MACVYGDEAEKVIAENGCRSNLAFYASTPSYRVTLDAHGWGDLQPELNRMTKAGRWAEMPQLVDDALLDALCVRGTRTEGAGPPGALRGHRGWVSLWSLTHRPAKWRPWRVPFGGTCARWSKVRGTKMNTICSIMISSNAVKTRDVQGLERPSGIHWHDEPADRLLVGPRIDHPRGEPQHDVSSKRREPDSRPHPATCGDGKLTTSCSTWTRQNTLTESSSRGFTPRMIGLLDAICSCTRIMSTGFREGPWNSGPTSPRAPVEAIAE